jgi:glycosyltransferase involved in cell wall biosynthesis
VIFQSATAPLQTNPKPKDVFQVCVLAHLREVKDPLRAAYAARLLPSTSRIQVVHAGQALSEIAAQEAREEEKQNVRYRWLEGLPREESQKLLAGSHLLTISSILEGGANVVSEAIAASVPILASRIPGNVGILGDDYPGYFETGHTQQLSTLLERAESDHSFFQTLVQACQRLTHLVDSAREANAWRALLGEFVVS